MSQLNNELNTTNDSQAVKVDDLAQFQNHETDRQSALELVEIKLTQGLQRSLDIQTLLEFFSREIAAIVPCDSVGYQNSEHRVAYAYGQVGIHMCKYELTIDDTYMGVLVCTRDKPFGDLDLLTIESLTATLIYPLRNALMYEQAINLAMHDSLTGVGNRKALTRALRRETSISRRQDQPYCVCMIDIDHFKTINDDYGHAAGDQALKHVTHIVDVITRETDELFRYGGEEFVLVLNNTNQHDADQLAERIRSAIEQSAVYVKDYQFSVTVSIGVAEYDPITGADSIIDKADVALYKAKQSGRNQIHAAC